MPLVLAQNEVNLSDLTYADVLGETYEFPSRYRNKIVPGEQFVYYRGRRRAEGSTSIPEYFGSGIISSVSAVGDRFRCTITDYQAFLEPVPFKSDDSYREPTANSRKSVGFYFSEGVRTIDQDAFDSIVDAGLGSANKEVTYADSDASQEVDRVAMALAMANARERFPDCVITQMPHSNPGFDIEVREDDAIKSYIEVKGTQASYPRFFITAGELAHSVTHSDQYRLWIYYRLSIEEETAAFVEHQGAVSSPAIELTPTQYFGQYILD